MTLLKTAIENRKISKTGGFMDRILIDQALGYVKSLVDSVFEQKLNTAEKQFTVLIQNTTDKLQQISNQAAQELNQEISDEKRQIFTDIQKNITQLESLYSEMRDVLEANKQDALNKLDQKLTVLFDSIDKFKGEPGEPGQPGIQGEPGKSVTKEEVLAVIRPQVEKELKQLREQVRANLKKAGKGGGGTGDIQHESKSVSAGSTTVQTSYPIAANGNALIKVAYRKFIWHKDIDFTVGADRKTLTFTSDASGTFINSSTVEITYIRG